MLKRGEGMHLPSALMEQLESRELETAEGVGFLQQKEDILFFVLRVAAAASESRSMNFQ